MLNKKAQMGAIAFAVFTLILGSFLGYFIGKESNSLTGNVINVDGENYECQLKQINANYELVNSSSCSDKEAFYKKASCTVKLKNREKQPISAEPLFNCETLTDKGAVIAQKQALLPEETGEFKIGYENNGKDWKRTLGSAQTNKFIETVRQFKSLIFSFLFFIF